MFLTPVMATSGLISSTEFYFSPKRPSSTASGKHSRSSSITSDPASISSKASSSRRLRRFRKLSSTSINSQSTSSSCEAHPPYQISRPTTPIDCERHTSDLLVRCRNELYNVHRSVVCRHSYWFENVCAKVFTSTSNRVIDLSADNSDAVAAMMQYCYQLDYTERHHNPNLNIQSSALQLHVDVYLLAQRYSAPGMKDLALQKFETLAATILAIGSDEEEISRVVSMIYAPGRALRSDGLRCLVVKLCADHIEKFARGNRRTAAKLFHLIDELPEFRSDIFEKVAERWK